MGVGNGAILFATAIPHGLIPSSAEAGHDCGMYSESVMHGVEAGSTGIVGGAVLLVTSALHGWNISSAEAGRDYGLYT